MNLCGGRAGLGRTVLHFQLEGEPRQRRYWWIVVQRDADPDVDVCRTDPGHPVTLTVTAALRSLVDLLMQDAEIGESLRRGLLVLDGEPELARRFETLFAFEEGSGILPGGGRQEQRRVGALSGGE